MKRENIKEQIKYLESIGIDTTICFECGSEKDIEYHHIIPYTLGGRRVVPLCGNCHNRVHKGRTRKDSHKELIKNGIQKAKERALEAGLGWSWGGGDDCGSARAAKLAKTAEWRASIIEICGVLHAQGLKTYKSKAEWLNANGFRSQRGNLISVPTLRNALIS